MPLQVDQWVCFLMSFADLAPYIFSTNLLDILLHLTPIILIMRPNLLSIQLTVGTSCPLLKISIWKRPLAQTNFSTSNQGKQMCFCSNFSLSNKLVIDTPVFPDCLYIACVTPCFKRGDKKSSNNYLPISILSTVARIKENILSNLYKKFFGVKLDLDCQFGFMKRRNRVLWEF